MTIAVDKVGHGVATPAAPLMAITTDPVDSVASCLAYVVATFGANTVPTGFTCTDNKGNTYVQIGAVLSTYNGSWSSYVVRFYCENAAGGAGHTATVTQAGPGPGFWTVALVTATGLLQSGALDQSNGQAGYFGTPYSSGNVAILANKITAAQLALSAFTTYSSPVTYGEATGFASLYQQTIGDWPAPPLMAVAAKVLSAPGNYAASWTDGYAGTYALIVVDTFVGGAPTITAQPQGVARAVGSTNTFGVTATASAGTLHRQWQSAPPSAPISNVPGAWTDIPGAMGATVTTGVLGWGDHGSWFRCLLSDDLGAIFSDAVRLHITPMPASGRGDALGSAYARRRHQRVSHDTWSLLRKSVGISEDPEQAGARIFADFYFGGPGNSAATTQAGATTAATGSVGSVDDDDVSATGATAQGQGVAATGTETVGAVAASAQGQSVAGLGSEAYAAATVATRQGQSVAGTGAEAYPAGSVATGQAGQGVAATGASVVGGVTGSVTTGQSQGVAATGTEAITATAATAQGQTLAGVGAEAYAPATVATRQGQSVAAAGTATTNVTGTAASGQAQTVAGAGAEAYAPGTASTRQAQSVAAAGTEAYPAGSVATGQGAQGVAGIGAAGVAAYCSTGEGQTTDATGAVSGHGFVLLSEPGFIVAQPVRRFSVVSVARSVTARAARRAFKAAATGRTFHVALQARAFTVRSLEA